MAHNRVPWASWHPARFGGSATTGGARKITLHTMECGSESQACWPGYNNWGSTPHLSVHPGSGQARQHVLLDRSARALASPGSPSSPNMNAGLNIQIEIVGRAHDTPHYGDAWYRQLAEWLTWLCDEWHIPKVFPFDFGEDGTAGRHGKNRVSWAQYRDASGIVGHQNVPFNDHWDPGNLNQAKVLKFMGSPSQHHSVSRPAPAHHAAAHGGGWARGGNVYVSYLHHGNKDSDSVRNVQKRLIQMGYSIPAGPTGNWFSQTDAAVRKLQHDWRQAPQYATGKDLGRLQTEKLFRGVSGITIHP